MNRSVFLAALLIGVTGGSAPADIYVWQDVTGGEHYTNSLEGVPEDRRASATLFVRERPRAAPEPTPPAEEEPAALAAESEATEDRIVRAFAAGVEAATGAAAQGDVEIVPATIVQTTEVVVEPAERDTLVVGGFVPGHRGRRPPRDGGRPEEPDRAFVVGPAGPPPIGAAGPAPVFAE